MFFFCTIRSCKRVCWIKYWYLYYTHKMNPLTQIAWVGMLFVSPSTSSKKIMESVDLTLFVH